MKRTVFFMAVLLFAAIPLTALSACGSQAARTDVSVPISQPDVAGQAPIPESAPAYLRKMDDLTVEGFLKEIGPGYTEGVLSNFDPTVGYDEYLCIPVSLDFGLGVSGDEKLGFNWKWNVRKGETIQLSLTLNELPDTPEQVRYDCFSLAGGVIADQQVPMTVKIENARIELPDGKIELAQANGIHEVITDYVAPYQGASWQFAGFAGGELDLPDTKVLQQSAFCADVTLLDAKGPDKVDYYYNLAGNPPAPTPEWFQFLKAEGFRSIRFQMTWFNHMDDETDKIDTSWLDRVEHTLQSALDEGFYCTISVCGDAANFAVGLTDDEAANLVSPYGWLSLSGDPKTEERFASLWAQIAMRFRDYDEHLIFESINEPNIPDSMMAELGVIGAPNGHGVSEVGTAGENLNRLNQIFVDSVRKTGGNNEKRFLFVPPFFSKGVDCALRAFKLPDDPAAHTVVSLNRYLGDETVGGGDVFPSVKKYLLENGINAVFTEFGATAEQFSDEERIVFFEQEVPQARELNIPIFYYGGGNWGHFRGHPQENSPCFCLYNPYTFEPALPELIATAVGRAS